MWIGAMRLVVGTADLPDGGTESVVQAAVLRDDTELVVLNLDYPKENDLERGAIRKYDYSGPTKLPRRHDGTAEMPSGVAVYPMPYPGYGFEFSDGLVGHLRIELRINGDDLWIKDKVDLYVKFIREQQKTYGSMWREDPDWTYIGTWARDVALSRDPVEGVAKWTLVLTDPRVSHYPRAPYAAV